jgi:trehalose 6-phosphate phosphatase
LATDVDDASHEASHAAERIGNELPLLIDEPWLIVEPKPPSVAFHWRQAPDTEAAAARVTAAVDQLDPDRVLERFQGRRILELRPPGAVAKGEAFQRLVDELKPRSVFLLGDDVSDAMAFTELRRMREAGVTDGIAVAVQARAEVPPQVLEAADIVLASPVDATRFLSALASRLTA